MSPESIATSCVNTLISDHFAIRGEIVCTVQPPIPVTHMARNYNKMKLNKDNFAASLASVDWEEVAARGPSADDLARSIVLSIQNKVDVCFPMRRVPQKKVENSWIDENILNTKSLLFDVIGFINKYPFPYLNEIAFLLQEKYSKMLRNKRSKYYTHHIKRANNPNKSMWHVVRVESGRKNKSSSDYTESIKQADGRSFSTKKELVDMVNAKFIHAALSCGAPQADPNTALAMLLETRPPAGQCLWLHPFSPIEVYRIITKRIARKPTKDLYDTSVELLYIAAASLASVLAVLFNRCLRTGCYPSTFKKIKVSPLYKGKGKKSDANNYRPVAIIPAVAKVFESGICDRLLGFLEKTDCLTDRQYAYRRGRSATALARMVVRDVMRAREEKQQVAVLFCDLSKAFDVADHGVLALKMRHLGVEGKALELLLDFLKGRSQVVIGDGGKVRSDPLDINKGVPQGSSLSNIMFSLLLNDLPGAITEANVFMYADDVAAVVCAPSMEKLQERLNVVVGKINNWFQINGLILNTTKTHYMHFNLSGRTCTPLSLRVGNSRVEQVRVTTFLGFELDSSLTWGPHIDKMCGKLGRACFALERLAQTLPRKMLRGCYFALVHSVLQYGVEFWGRAADWERAFRMQKRAVRAITRSRWDDTAGPLFKVLKILTVPAMVILQAAVYVRQHLSDYNKRGDRHNYCTRGRDKLVGCPHSLTKSGKLIHVMGPAVYNRLPNEIVSATSENVFKRKLKDWLTDQALYDLKEWI